MIKIVQKLWNQQSHLKAQLYKALIFLQCELGITSINLSVSRHLLLLQAKQLPTNCRIILTTTSRYYVDFTHNLVLGSCIVHGLTYDRVLYVVSCAIAIL